MTTTTAPAMLLIPCGARGSAGPQNPSGHAWAFRRHTANGVTDYRAALGSDLYDAADYRGSLRSIAVAHPRLLLMDLFGTPKAGTQYPVSPGWGADMLPALLPLAQRPAFVAAFRELHDQMAAVDPSYVSIVYAASYGERESHAAIRAGLRMLVEAGFTGLGQDVSGPQGARSKARYAADYGDGLGLDMYVEAAERIRPETAHWCCGKFGLMSPAGEPLVTAEGTKLSRMDESFNGAGWMNQQCQGCFPLGSVAQVQLNSAPTPQRRAEYSRGWAERGVVPAVDPYGLGPHRASVGIRWAAAAPAGGGSEPNNGDSQ